jgi:hypothetical protein
LSAVVYGNLPSGQSGSGSTVGAVTADLVTMAVPSGVRWKVTGYALGSEPTPATASLTVSQTVFNNAGTTALIGALGTLLSNIDATLTGALLTLVVSGGNIILRATGVAAKTITWSGKLSVDLVL